MAYPKALVSIWIWYFESKYLRIEALIKAFYRCMKAFLALKVRKFVLELTFANLAFNKSDFLDLVDFAMVDKFLIFLLTSLLSALAVPLGTS